MPHLPGRAEPGSKIAAVPQPFYRRSLPHLQRDCKTTLPDLDQPVRRGLVSSPEEYRWLWLAGKAEPSSAGQVRTSFDKLRTGSAPTRAVALIGVISDTHGLLRPEALAALRGSDYIIHAGDIGDPAILTKLAAIAPVTAIRGNVDREPWASKIPATNVLEVRGVSIYILHNLKQLDLKPEAAGFGVVVCGHTHVARAEMKNGVLYFNPGSAGPRRFRLPVMIGRLKVKDGEVSSELIEILREIE
jgi:putative phosphoesterase